LQLVDLSLLIVSSVLGLFLAVYVARRRRASGAQALSVMILGASIWSLGYVRGRYRIADTSGQLGTLYIVDVDQVLKWLNEHDAEPTD
jgi:hypothetical protein